MALKSKKKTEVENTKQEKEVVMTPEEKEAIQKQEAEIKEAEIKEAGANTMRLDLATSVVSKQFSLDENYKVTKFDDKGKVVNMTLENEDFIVSVTIKDSGRHGMHTDL